jgi:hypothetical protein
VGLFARRLPVICPSFSAPSRDHYGHLRHIPFPFFFYPAIRLAFPFLLLSGNLIAVGGGGRRTGGHPFLFLGYANFLARKFIL